MASDNGPRSREVDKFWNRTVGRLETLQVFPCRRQQVSFTGRALLAVVESHPGRCWRGMSKIPTSPAHSFSRVPSTSVNQLLQTMAGGCTLAQFVELLNNSKLDKDMHVTAGVPLLHFMAGHGRVELVGELLRRKASLDAAGGGLTPLHFAVSRDRSECANGEDERRAETIALLVRAGVDVNKREQRGWTALKFAVRFRLLACVTKLLDMGASPDVPDVEGFACLHNSAGSVELTRTLLPYVRAIDQQNNRGQTALVVSLVQSDFASALLLIEHGANPNTVDVDGELIVWPRGLLSFVRWVFYS